MTFALSEPYRIPVFAPRTPEDLAADKYEDTKQRLAEGYTAQWAYGYLFLKRGESEGFYRTINELGFSAPRPQDGVHCVLEIGCGVGRTSCDYARHYPDAYVVGLDYSPRLLSYAYRMVIGDATTPTVSITLDEEGYETVSERSFFVPNACFIQGNALNLPFAADLFDLVVSPNLIDRIPDPMRMLQEAVRVLRPGGHLVLADPFNWTAQPVWWSRIRTIDNLSATLTQCGLTIDLAFDGVVYREVQDARNAYTEWSVAVVRARKAP
jgi:ubiquinone/menaquinone biosynthesis C-methylase UbiE